VSSVRSNLSEPQFDELRRGHARIRQMRDLGLSVYTLDGFHRFLRTSYPVFDDRTTLQLIEQGEIERVIVALATDYEGLGV